MLVAGINGAGKVEERGLCWTMVILCTAEVISGNAVRDRCIHSPSY